MNGNGSSLVNDLTFNLKFEICTMLETYVDKLYSFICVHVHFRIRNTSKEVFIVDAMKTILAY